jgi:hypothetical protein
VAGVEEGGRERVEGSSRRVEGGWNSPDLKYLCMGVSPSASC